MGRRMSFTDLTRRAVNANLRSVLAIQSLAVASSYIKMMTLHVASMTPTLRQKHPLHISSPHHTHPYPSKRASTF